MKRYALLVALLGTSWLAGCHRVTFINGPTEAASKPVYEKHLNSAFVANVVDIDPPERLEVRCPQGWARLETKRSVYTALLEMLGGWVYSARSADLHCAEAPTGSGATTGDSASPTEPEAPTPATEPEPQPPGDAAPDPQSTDEQKVMDI